VEIGQSAPRFSGVASYCWSVKRQSGSHKTLERDGWPNYTFSFHDNDEIGPVMLSRIAKQTGLTPDDL